MMLRPLPPPPQGSVLLIAAAPHPDEPPFQE